VTSLASAGTAPTAGNRAGDYDYIIGVRTPTHTEIAVGGKSTASSHVTW
jgi:hypothetical protein